MANHITGGGLIIDFTTYWPPFGMSTHLGKVPDGQRYCLSGVHFILSQNDGRFRRQLLKGSPFLTETTASTEEIFHSLCVPHPHSRIDLGAHSLSGLSVHTFSLLVHSLFHHFFFTVPITVLFPSDL